MSNEKQYNNIFIGKLKNRKTKDGSRSFTTILIDNPSPTKKDSDEPNPYFKGSLLWAGADGSIRQIKQLAMSLNENGQEDKYGNIGSVYIKTDDTFSCELVQAPADSSDTK